MNEEKKDSRRIYFQETESSIDLPLGSFKRGHPSGSIELESFAKSVEHMTEELFCRAFKQPFLVQADKSAASMPQEAFDTAYIDTDILPLSAEYACLIFPIVKHGRNAFADMVTIGRTSNNDLVVPHLNVSKFHAYFRRVKGKWALRDANSKNGTFIAEKRLQPGQDYRLIDKSLISLSDRIGFIFFLPATLFRVITSYQGGDR